MRIQIHDTRSRSTDLRPRICADAASKLSCAATLGTVLVADLAPQIVRLSRRRVSWPEMMRRKSVKIAKNRDGRYSNSSIVVMYSMPSLLCVAKLLMWLLPM